MEEGVGGDSANNLEQPAIAARWTCEACGCNTNQSTDRSCTICGTSHSGPSLLRRGGAGFAAAARAGWFGRGLASARRAAAAQDDVDIDEDDQIWESVVDGVEMANEDPESAIESLAMEVSGMANAARNRMVETNRQRFLDAARAFAQVNHTNNANEHHNHHNNTSHNNNTNIDHALILRYATLNAPSYQPRWAKISQLVSPRARGVNAIEVPDENGRLNIAHVPVGSSEGRAIRAEDTLPTQSNNSPANSISLGAFTMPLPGNALLIDQRQQQQRAKNIFGFRVAFDLSTCESGGNMGGCYLIGVTTNSFTAYGEHNALQQTPFFWGIEDSGRKYEGSRRPVVRSRRTVGAASPFAVDLSPTDVPMNASNVLFGNNEVVTVVCDVDHRTMTFWRDDTLLGTLITTLPRGSSLYPVVVPFNRGVTVAITGMDADPIPLLRSYAIICQEAQHRKHEKVRVLLAHQRSILISNGRMTPALRAVLVTIFASYSKRNIPGGETNPSLSYPQAVRLWYRCGMRLSALHTVLQQKQQHSDTIERKQVTFDDFLRVMDQIVFEDEIKNIPAAAPGSVVVTEPSFRVGDRVELVDGFEKFGDAPGGPLQPGDRGVVVDLQTAPTGERRSVRVLFGGRRWWYQPQAVQSERSGLIESPAVWFIRRILRAHSYDHITLRPLTGENVRGNSCQIGDFVKPKPGRRSSPEEGPSCYGRIVPEAAVSATTPAASTSRGRDAATISVEFVDPLFAEGTGVGSVTTTEASPVLEVRKVRVAKLAFADSLKLYKSAMAKVKVDVVSGGASPSDPMGEDGSSNKLSERLKVEIASLARLDRSAIEFLTKESTKSTEALASLFSAGLPEAVLASIDVAERQMNSLEPREDIVEKISLIGKLCATIADQLFTEQASSSASTMMSDATADDASRRSSVRIPVRELSARQQQAARAGNNEEPSNNNNNNLNNNLNNNNNNNNNNDNNNRDAGSQQGSQHMQAYQQRRSMLLSLMSRARRGTSASYLSELIERENAVFGADLAGSQGLSALSSMHGIALPFSFGAQAGNILQEGQWGEEQNYGAEDESGTSILNRNEESNNLLNNNNNNRTIVSSSTAGAGASDETATSFLYSILRSGGEVTDDNSSRPAGTNQALFARHLITSGILMDSVSWVKASVDAQAKKIQLSSIQKSSSVLRDVVDEEGTPLLQLAIAFGCSPEVLSYLISRGASVGPLEVKEAAITDQPNALSVLLQHTSYSEDFENCGYSPGVMHAFTEARRHQIYLDTKMREAAGAFMVKLLRRLLLLGLSARRHQSPRVELCSRAIAEIFVGNVLLRNLELAQKKTEGTTDTTTEAAAVARMEEDNAGLLAELETASVSSCSANSTPMGLLATLPLNVINDAVVSSLENTTTFLSLVEDYLCSKDMSDIASGLTILLTLLNKIPSLRTSEEMERFGILGLLTFHEALASSCMNEILAKQTKNKDETESSGAPKGSSPRNTVVCPKKHTAVIHITCHSSFRCDICGRGVDRGRPMHGCRECDWDACEHCTDKSESGLVKSTAIKDIIGRCVTLLTENPPDVDCCDKRSPSQLQMIASRLLRRDVLAMNELCALLKTPGAITIHEFMNVILPTLHDCFIGRSENSVSSGHRSKKARVGDDGDDGSCDSPEERLLFCKEAVRLLVHESDCAKGAKTASGGDLSQGQEAHGGGDAGEGKSEESTQIHCSEAAQELLRRLHQILSLRESVRLISLSIEDGGYVNEVKGSDLQALTRPIEIKLSPSAFSAEVESEVPIVIYAEPMVPVKSLKRHVLRSFKLTDPSYIEFCNGLADSKSIIIERPPDAEEGQWKIAEVQSFDSNTGAHVVHYGKFLRGKIDTIKLLREGSPDMGGIMFHYDDKAMLLLAARDYFIVRRSYSESSIYAAALQQSQGRTPMQFDFQIKGDFSSNHASNLRKAIGCRVQSNCVGDWRAMTLLGMDDTTGFILIEDDGTVRTRIMPEQIRLPNSDPSIGRNEIDPRLHGWASHGDRATLNRAFPFLAARQRPDIFGDSDGSSSSRQSQPVGVLKRSWSALSLVDAMRPVELDVSLEDTKDLLPKYASLSGDIVLDLKVGDDVVKLVADCSIVECPPKLEVKFGIQEKLPVMDLTHPGDQTLISALRHIYRMSGKEEQWMSKRSCQLFFSIDFESHCHASIAARKSDLPRVSFEKNAKGAYNNEILFKSFQSDTRSRKLSSRSLSSEDEDLAAGLCDGLDDISVSCMQVISLICEFAQRIPSASTDVNAPSFSLFSNSNLSKKLLDQLEDPVSVVGQALPEWCTSAPSFAPRVFSYESRRTLLERSAFGVSRSTLKQQEAKVNVGRLRQRMASLRARAVELVGEAFSGGAEDPTALQLQADELYGMEEALAARVRASFRAVKWEEHSLQVAKAVVRRENLLYDAMAVMERYVNDNTIKCRRLEVRFKGESGFDAASGNEAGVTRGFYADVAEVLLSSESVSGVFCSSSCSLGTVGSPVSKLQSLDLDAVQQEASKLPLWIPDMDSTSQVVIPTPRANESSSLGVYPRPLPKWHPQMNEVLQRFRFIGRLFAAAMRDGFMFPLPLSSSFLKLVQLGADTASCKKACSCDSMMTSADLPRQGFLAGEIFAADAYICKVLDTIDAADPPLSRLELDKRYQEIATDRHFARVALGKSYDCSFEEYFQDRTFVDPLDPTQGVDAYALCQKGHRKPVTIYNIREWVALCKNFFLHEGVIQQAMAFRQGVEDFFCSDYLRLFTPDELQRDVCGGADCVDTWDESAVRKLFKLDGGKGAAEALVAVAAIGGEGGAALSRRFSPTSPTISHLVKALLEATPKQRRQFLSFVTSVPIVTPGRIEIIPIVSPSGDFLPMHDPACLPRANTCARRLYLPKFDSYESFSQVLWAVVREESKFKGFFEWRGNT